MSEHLKNVTLAASDMAREIAGLKTANARLTARVAELEKDSALLAALEAAGVDNWEGYSDAVEAGESR